MTYPPQKIVQAKGITKGIEAGHQSENLNENNNGSRHDKHIWNMCHG